MASAAPSGDGCADRTGDRRVKLLCSLGGRILPRPSDGALRYAGGDTRIVSVPRSAALPVLLSKISDAYGPAVASPFTLRYQLPFEELDSLITVSTAEDLDNMMEEYDKLLSSSPASGPSPKLRVFLFPISDPTASAAEADPDTYDPGLKYLEAVNGVIPRKDSTASLVSMPNSDGAAAVADGHGGGTSPALLSPASTASTDATRSFFGVPAASPFVPLVDVAGLPQPNKDLQPTQVVNLQSVPYIPPTAPLSANPSNAMNNSVLPAENHSEIRAAQLPSEAKYRQPLSQFPPLPPAFLNPQKDDQYGLQFVPQPFYGNTLKLEDCALCQKALPHAHSDTLVNDFTDGHVCVTPGPSPIFHSLRQEDLVRMIASERGMTGGLSDSGMGSQGDKAAAVGQVGPYGYKQIQTMPHEERVILPMAGNLPASTINVSATSQNCYQLLIDPTSCYPKDLHVPLTGGPSPYQIRPDTMNSLYLADSNFASNSMHQEDQFWQNNVPLSSNSHVKPVDRMMEAVHVNPPEISGSSEQWKPVVTHDIGIPQKLKADYKQPALEHGFMARPEVGRNDIYLNNTIFNDPEQKLTMAMEPVALTSYAATHFQTLHPANLPYMQNRTGIDGSYPYYYLETGVGAAGLPTTIPTDLLSERKDAVPEARSHEIHNEVTGPLNGNVYFYPATANTQAGVPEQLQEPVMPDPPALPLKPKRVASKESLSPKDPSANNPVLNQKALGAIVPSDEGGIHHQPDILNKEQHMEPGRYVEGGDFVQQDLHITEDQAVASTLQSSESQPHMPIADGTNESVAFTEGIGANANISDGENHSTEVIKSKQVEWIKAGFPAAEDLGRLQIIKNSDLEELQELGSGTFGTVYHGKWKGSDVAIKRINDRCFSGKPSEQERMRSDFWNEASKLADLHHPNVVAFYGIVLDGPGGSIATVTEFMVNGSLRHALQKNDKTLDRRKRLIIAMDAAFGMEYLHSKNIIHFDLKSDNLLVNLRDPQRPICKVGDLGLSKVKCQTLISGGVRGTLPWMAPELLNGSSSLVSEKVDVFSFGIVMWELLTGEEPYADLHYGVIIGGIVTNTLRPKVPESCDPEWRSLMEQSWSTEPSERPSFTEIASRLRSMASSPQKAHPPQT